MSFSTKRWAYSDKPSFSSQSAICCTTTLPADLPRPDPERTFFFGIWGAVLRNIAPSFRVQSGLRPANLTTLPHFSISLATNRPKSAGRLKLQQVDFRQHGPAPWCALTVSGQGGAFGSLAAAALRAGASAASGILSRHQKFLLQKRLSHKGYPLYGQKPFLDRFLSEGA
jgi:hypothetical protein